MTGEIEVGQLYYLSSPDKKYFLSGSSKPVALHCVDKNRWLIAKTDSPHFLDWSHPEGIICRKPLSELWEERKGEFWFERSQTKAELFHLRVAGSNSDYIYRASQTGPVYLRENPDDDDSLWRLSPATKYPQVIRSYHQPPTMKYLEFPKVKKGAVSVGRSTPPQLVGETVLPWTVRAEKSQLAIEDQARRSPYYILRRWASWRFLKSESIPANTQITVKVTKETGLTHTEERENTNKKEDTLTIEADVKFKGVGPKFSKSITNSIMMKALTNISRTDRKSETFERQVKASPHGYHIESWAREDTFELLDSNGVSVAKWTTSTEDPIFLDDLPEQAVPAAPAGTGNHRG
ncbi:hypothetical protein [Amycolatopsis sp. NPDC051071]|uniref:hypothetical protein n=1 Tax=Amycolatopsis sp. NPDC051071 TaxID=3154637 RepID=UPI0034134FDC